MAGMTYVFELGTIDGSPDPVYSNPESITLDACPGKDILLVQNRKHKTAVQLNYLRNLFIVEFVT